MSPRLHAGRGTDAFGATTTLSILTTRTVRVTPKRWSRRRRDRKASATATPPIGAATTKIVVTPDRSVQQQKGERDPGPGREQRELAAAPRDDDQGAEGGEDDEREVEGHDRREQSQTAAADELLAGARDRVRSDELIEAGPARHGEKEHCRGRGNGEEPDHARLPGMAAPAPPGDAQQPRGKQGTRNAVNSLMPSEPLISMADANSQPQRSALRQRTSAHNDSIAHARDGRPIISATLRAMK